MSNALERLLRTDADNFVLTVAVYADETGEAPAEIALRALADALARQTESGALGTSLVSEENADG